jgi:hypothetical protein
MVVIYIIVQYVIEYYQKRIYIIIMFVKIKHLILINLIKILEKKKLIYVIVDVMRILVDLMNIIIITMERKNFLIIITNLLICNYLNFYI